MGSQYLEHASTKIADPELLKIVVRKGEKAYALRPRHWFISPIGIFFFRMYHTIICMGLSIFVRDEATCKKYYMYYSPFGRVTPTKAKKQKYRVPRHLKGLSTALKRQL
jgi:hypothetical protein